MFSNKAEYAVRAMSALARIYPRALRSQEIAQIEGIPARFLSEILARLKKTRLLRTSRGPGGGSKLAADPRQITIYDIITSVQNIGPLYHCLGSSNSCLIMNNCLLRDVYYKIEQTIESQLRAIFLSDIAGTLDSKRPLLKEIEFCEECGGGLKENSI